MHAHISENRHYCSTVYRNQQKYDPQFADNAHFHCGNLVCNYLLTENSLKCGGEILHDSTTSSVISDSYIACDLRLSGPLLCPVYSLFIVCLKGLYSVEINILYLNENYEAELVYCPECTELLQTEARCVCHEPPKGPRNLSEILLHKSSVYPCTFVYLGPT